MKIAFYLFFLLAALLISLSVKSAPLNEFWDFYVGGDAQIRHMKYVDGFGSNMLRKHSPQGNLYAGVYLTDRVALEVGYESTIAKKKRTYVHNGQILNGNAIPNGIDYILLESKVRIKGFHFDLMHFTNLGGHSPWKFFAGIGICEMKGAVKRDMVQVHGHPLTIKGSVRCFCKHYTALRLSTGLQYEFENGFGLRGTLSFVKTRKMAMTLSDSYERIALPVFKPKDSFVIGIGGVYTF